jgi:hypothetical protein
MPNFVWGDSVRVRLEASPESRPGAVAAVVGVLDIERLDQSRKYQAAMGTKVYTIEFGDGVSIQVPAAWVDPAEQQT